MNHPGAYQHQQQPQYQPQQSHDPYRAQAPGAGFAPIGSTARWIFVAIISMMGLGFGIAVAAWTIAIIRSVQSPYGAPPDDTLMAFGALGLVVLVTLLYAQIATGLVWLYRAWSWIPQDQRYTKHTRNWLVPSHVALMMLIPYYHYYWMFVANCGLCDALDRLRVRYPTSAAAPKSLAIAACICQLLIPFPVGSLLWLIFMGKVEKMTREMSASMALLPHA